MDEHLSNLDVTNFKKMIERAVREYPNFKIVATTLRNARTATINDWGAVCYCDGEFHQSRLRENLEIFDRVGGGDSFASGLIYGRASFKPRRDQLQEDDRAGGARISQLQNCRDDAAQRQDRDDQRLGRGLLLRRRIPSIPVAREPRNLRSGRRRRFIRLGVDLRIPDRQRATTRGRIRRGAWRVGDDYAW